MMIMKNYWEQRTKQNNAKALKQAAHYSRLEKKLYQNALREIENALNALLVEGVDNLSRTELWRMSKYINLRQIIESQCNDIATGQVHIVEDALNAVFETTIGETMEKFRDNRFNLVTDQLRSQLINSNWSGKNYSSRVWTNSAALSQRLQKSMEDMIILGKSSTEIKRQLASDMKVAWRIADRLIRTESAHLHTEASKECYKAAGVKKVKWINSGAGEVGCDICASRDNVIFSLTEVPTLPAHPNCTCCLAPVIEEIK